VADDSGRSTSRRGRKHVLVREYVRSVIVSAEPGTPAPSERDLAEQFGVARMTVRHAIDALVAQGLLERVAGRGTFVTKPLIDMQMRLSSYTEEMERRGKRPESKTLLARRESAGPGVARALEIEESTSIAHWQRLRLADGVPMTIQHVYLSLDLFNNFLDEQLPSSLYTWFAVRDLMPSAGRTSWRSPAASTAPTATPCGCRCCAPSTCASYSSPTAATSMPACSHTQVGSGPPRSGCT
jgi:GntR family transcriptional regulator